MMERIKPNERPEGCLARLEQAGVIRRSRTARPLEALSETEAPKVKQSVVNALIDERCEGR